jgi:hypothetical protein
MPFGQSQAATAERRASDTGLKSPHSEPNIRHFCFAQVCFSTTDLSGPAALGYLALQVRQPTDKRDKQRKERQ